MTVIDKLYLEYCGYKPEEVDWDYTTSQKYKTFKAGYDAMQKLINDKGLALQSDMDKTIAQNFALKSRIMELETDLINTKVLLKETIAKETGIQWHNLLKNPNDLPPERQRILCWTTDPWCHNQDGVKKGKHCDVEMGTYMGNGKWYMGCYHTCVTPKAWCEIPIFDKE